MRYNLRSIIKIAWKALLTNKSRSALTTLGIVIGVMAVVLLVSFGSGLEQEITKQFEDLGTDLLFVMPGKFQFRDSREGGPPGVATNKLTIKDADRVAKKAPSVAATLPIVNTNVNAEYRGEEHDTFLLGVNEHYEEFRNSPVSAGRWFGSKDVDSAKRIALIGTTVVEELFGTADPLGKKVTIGGKKYTIIGVLESKGGSIGNDQDDTFIAPITTVQRQFDIDKLSYFYIQVKAGVSLDKATKDVEKVLLKTLEEDEFSVLNSEDLLATFQTILGTLTAALGGIAAISLVVGGIGIMNIMLVSVTERTREIGLRKAVGATPNIILLQFLVEAVILSWIGGTIGILLAFALGLLANNFLPVNTPLWAVVIAFVVSAAVGIIFGVFPARKASKLSPIEALRYE